ncbi:MAG: asbF [Acidobacteria bacterium]|nr:asbF [Acidobacteriota bacterium]
MAHHATRRDFLRVGLAGAAGAAVGLRGLRLDAQGSLASRLAVCSWSLEPTSAEDLFARLGQTGLARVQIALDPIRANEGGRWAGFGAAASRRGITLVSGMMGTVGEDYTTLESIRRTGGVVPDATWPETWKNVQADAEIAGQLGLQLVTFHAGFLPHEESDPNFAKLQGRVRQIADLFAGKKMAIALETGQEEAATLAAFLKKLDRANVGINLDPANMILYGKGDPVAALDTLGPWVRQCHLKDAVRTKKPGEWGEEVRLGSGEVNWKAFFGKLESIGFKGNLCIEREAGKERVADIRFARGYVEGLLGVKAGISG